MSSWLMKAEPDTRLVNGHDVRFSVEDWEREGVSSWEGVRSHEAKKILSTKMKLNDRMVLYASNTKLPGVSGVGSIVKEGYPDHNAFDPKHPYYDPKSVEVTPTWFMVDVKFSYKLDYFVPLKLFQILAALDSPPGCTPYLTQAQLDGIKAMALLNRGRLSVQPLTEEVYEAVLELGTKGGWEELIPSKPVKRVAKPKPEVNEDDEEKPKKKAKVVKEEKLTKKEPKVETDIQVVGRASSRGKRISYAESD